MYNYFILLDYSRNFEIRENVFLDESDIQNLWRTNIANLVQKQMVLVCFLCHKFNEKEQLVTLECSCQMCESCLQTFLDQATQGFMLLLGCEKSN